jgi:hypothetical protein
LRTGRGAWRILGGSCLLQYVLLLRRNGYSRAASLVLLIYEKNAEEDTCRR